MVYRYTEQKLVVIETLKAVHDILHVAMILLYYTVEGLFLLAVVELSHISVNMF